LGEFDWLSNYKKLIRSIYDNRFSFHYPLLIGFFACGFPEQIGLVDELPPLGDKNQNFSDFGKLGLQL